MSRNEIDAKLLDSERIVEARLWWVDVTRSSAPLQFLILLVASWLRRRQGEASATTADANRARACVLTSVSMNTWTEFGEFHHVEMRLVPAGAAPARKAIRARLLGDWRRVLFYAQQTLQADRYANAQRAAGKPVRRGNVIGNAWSAWYEAITGRPSGW